MEVPSGSSTVWSHRLTNGAVVSPGSTAGLRTSHGDENGAHDTGQRPAKLGGLAAGGGVKVPLHSGTSTPFTDTLASTLETAYAFGISGRAIAPVSQWTGRFVFAV